MSSSFPIKKHRDLFNIGLVANTLEWYELSLYAYLAPIMGKLFLQHNLEHPIMGLVGAWSMLVVSYLARPLGSIFWGYIGDRKNCSFALRYSLLVMAIPGLLIGCLPTYEQIGILSTIALCILRFIQGFAAGGENSLNSGYMLETAPREKRGFFVSTVAASGIIGFLGGSLVITLLFLYFDEKTILSGAWRLPYLSSIPIFFYIVHVRKSIQSPQNFTQSQTAQPSSFTRLLIGSRLFSTLGLCVLIEVSTHIIFMFLPTYLTYFLKIPITNSQAYNTFGLAMWSMFTLLSGYLSDRINYRHLLKIYIFFILIACYPLFLIMQTASYGTLLVCYLIFAWVLGGLSGIQMQILANNFPEKIRILGMGLSYTFSSTIFGSTAPLICTYFIEKTGVTLFPAYYILLAALLTLPNVFLVRFKSL